MTVSIRDGLKAAYQELDRQNTHAGLLLDHYLHEITSGDKPKLQELYDTVCSMQPPTIYQSAFDRWRALHDADPQTLIEEMTFAGRLVVGLGQVSVRETGITLHPTYGTPTIPGSALKGLAHSYACWWLEQGDDASTDHKCLMAGLFGDTTSASHVTWHDAWYVPDSAPNDRPLVLDVMTPHHKRYYTSASDRAWPSDFDDPTPVNFLSARGSYLVALRGTSKDWADRALTLLSYALTDWGIGAKTSSGYGRTTLTDETAHSPEMQLPATHPFIDKIENEAEKDFKPHVHSYFHDAMKFDNPVRLQALKAMEQRFASSRELNKWFAKRKWHQEFVHALEEARDNAKSN